MKSVNGLLIGILISFCSYGQDVSIPDSTATNVIEELIEKDRLERVVISQDTIILTLKKENSNLESKIVIYKTKEDEWQQIITNLREQLTAKDVIISDLKKQLRNSIRIGPASVGIAIGVILLLLLL